MNGECVICDSRDPLQILYIYIYIYIWGGVGGGGAKQTIQITFIIYIKFMIY